jgi:D-sedoheptulose 7-phosphate isomerase
MKSFRPVSALEEAQACLTALLAQEGFNENLEASIDLIVRAFEKNLPVLSCGNGGSACDAMHFAEEFTGRFRKNRPPLPAMAISDPAHLTCVANDYGFENVFSRSVTAFGSSGAVLLAISTSGNSQNILKAIEAAHLKKMSVIGLTGACEGEMDTLCDKIFLIPSKSSERIQECHIKIIHTLIEGTERRLFPENYRES